MAKQAMQNADKVGSSQLVAMMAQEQHLDTAQFMNTVLKTCFQADATPEQFTAFLMIANEHKLNPITREIYAFQKGGKVSTIVSIDGWLKIINDHPNFDGMQFVDELDDAGNLVAVTCKIYRKDRKHPTEVTEYLDECKMPTEPWKKWPARMLRHKATIQAARYAFGFSGIMDADEAQRMDSIDGTATVVEDEPESPAKRIIHKVESKAEKKDIAPPQITEEPVEAESVELEDIPGLKKGSEIADAEMTEGQKEWVEDYDKAKNGE
jgi:hypothetical protein